MPPIISPEKKEHVMVKARGIIERANSFLKIEPIKVPTEIPRALARLVIAMIM